MKSGPLDKDDNPCRPRHFTPAFAPPREEDGQVNRSLELSRARLVMTGMMFVLVFGAICMRLADVTLVKQANSKLDKPVVVKPVEFGRADIIDRNGFILATTLDSPSLFGNPKLIDNPHQAAEALSEVLPGAKEAELEEKLSSGKSFVWLSRHLSPTTVEAVNQLGIPGLDFEHEEQRVYPQGSLTAHVVGYNDVDGRGLAGIERSFDNALKQQKEPLQLSLDVRLQAIVREEVQKIIDQFTAIGGTGIVMDVRTGEVFVDGLAPRFRPEQLRNHRTEDDLQPRDPRRLRDGLRVQDL